MNAQENKNQKKLEERIVYLEKNRRFVQNALEMALSMGDFLENINGKKDVKHILQATEKRIKKLYHLKHVFYIVLMKRIIRILSLLYMILISLKAMLKTK